MTTTTIAAEGIEEYLETRNVGSEA